MLALGTSLVLAACADVPPTAPSVAPSGGPSRVIATASGQVAEQTIAAGAVTLLAIQPDGTVVSWSQFDGDPVTNVPAGLSDVVSISFWGPHALALRADGTLAAWGYNANGQTNAPALTGVVDIGTGGEHSLAVRNDGTVVAWGYNYHGQSSVPPGLSDAVAVEGGGGHSLAIRRDGTVVGWGWNDKGQAQPPAWLHDVVAVAAGSAHSVALRRDGTVVAWGAPDAIQVPVGLSGVVAVSAGINHTLALKSDGTVVAWGGNEYGELDVPAGLSDVVAIDAGYDLSFALRRDGTVVWWGININSRRPPASLIARVPNSAPWAGGITAPARIVSGHRYTFAVAAGDPDGDALTYAWDMDSDGIPEQVSSLSGIYHAPAGAGAHTVGVTITDPRGAQVQRSITVSVEQNAAPVAVIQPVSAAQEGTVVYPRAVVTDANSASDPNELKHARYRWEFGDGTFSTAANPSKRYNDNGTYTLRLTVTDRGGASSSTQTQVQVTNVPPRATFLAPVSTGITGLAGFALGTRSVTDQALHDRSSLEVAFDCGAGYGAYIRDLNKGAWCIAPSSGSRLSIGLRVRDKDGGINEYRRTYAVR